MSQTLTDILVVIAAVFLVWLVIRLFRKPIRWILKLLLNTAIGFAALFLLNFFRQRHRHHARPQLDQRAGHRRGRVSGAGAAAADQISLLAYINVSPHPKMRETALSGRAGALRQLRPCAGIIIILARERPAVRRGPLRSNVQHDAHRQHHDQHAPEDDPARFRHGHFLQKITLCKLISSVLISRVPYSGGKGKRFPDIGAKKARRVKFCSTRRACALLLSAGGGPRACQDSVIDRDHVVRDDGGRLTIRLHRLHIRAGAAYVGFISRALSAA